MMQYAGAISGLTALSAGTAAGLSGETAEVFVRAEEVDPPLLTQDAGVVGELKATAAESQEPIVDYVSNTDGLEILTQFWLANSLLLEVDTSVVDLKTLQSQEGVRAIHENVEVSIPEPFSGASASQTGVTTYGLDQIGVPEAWEQFGTKGTGAKIAVLDTGVDPDHPDIDIAPENFAEFDEDGNIVEGAEPRDSDEHGTHVSGTATGGNDSGTAIGVAPAATLLHGLVLPNGGGTFAQIIGGMQWAVENDADVINMSLGATGYFAEMIEPVRNAEAAGTLVVSSAGNSGAGSTGSPGNVYDTFAVGASNESEAIADFSSGEEINTDEAWGTNAPDTWPRRYIVPDASAPGVDVLSAEPGGEYQELSGTSMASPHVAGLVGLMASAAEDAFGPGDLKDALSTTAWKPEGELTDPDTRYGHGIVDAVRATSRVGADSGFTGTIRDADGNSIEDATVDLNGFTVETDDTGSYRLRALPGEYEVVADAFGYSTTSKTATVSEGSFTQLDFELSDTAAVELRQGQPEGLEAGNGFDVVVRVANIESLTVELAGDYQGGADLFVEGEAARFGDPFSFDPPRSGEVTITVDVGDEGFGSLELAHSFTGIDRTIELTTGPTAVYAEEVPIAVVDVEDGPFTSDVVAILDDSMHPRFVFEELDPETALSAARNREHEAYVVQHLGEDEDRIAEFADVAMAPEIGVVYLDQFGDASDAVSQLSDVTGDPRDAFDVTFQLASPDIDYAIQQNHPVLEGVATEGERVTITRPDPIAIGPGLIFGGFHSYYEDYRGAIAGTTLADTAAGFDTTGSGFGVDDLTRTVLASSLGVSTFVTRNNFSADGRTILGNAVEHASQTPAIETLEVPADQIAPGESTTLRIEVEDLLELTIDVARLLFVDRSDLSLTIDGDDVGFGDTISFEEPFTGELVITIASESEGVGQFAFDTEFVTLGRRDHPIETAVAFPPTTIYESPLNVPEQIEDLQTAVDFVQPNDAVVLADGTYEVDAPDRGFQSGLFIETPGITLRAADGAEPQVIHARDLPAPRIIHVDAAGVTIDGVNANVLDGRVDEKNLIGTGILVADFTSGVTVKNLTAGGTFGVQLESTSDLTVENVTATDSITGVGTDIGFFGDIENATIRNITVRDSPDYSFSGGVVIEGGATEVTVTDCDIGIEDGDLAGIALYGPFGGGENCHIANNTVNGAGSDDEPFGVGHAGVVVSEVEATIEENDIEDTYFGVQVGGRLGFGEQEVTVRHNDIDVTGTGYYQTGDYATVERNDINAATGFDFGDGGFFGIEANQVLAQFNDLSKTDLPFTGTPYESFFQPVTPLVFDCRQNYIGERDYDDTIADGDIEYDPFLTAAPDEVDLPEPTRIGTDLYLDAGTSYGLGIPGPTDQTIFEVLAGEGATDFDGTVEFLNRNSERWQRVTGKGELEENDTLEAYRVTPSKGTRAVVDFQLDEDKPPGLRDETPGEYRLKKGWNFVAAPHYGDTGPVFGLDTVEDIEDPLASPASQLGDAERNAFTGYKVQVSEHSTLPASLTEYGPTMSKLYEALGLDPILHEDAGVTAASVALSTKYTIEDVLDAAPDDETATDAATTYIGRELIVAIATLNEDESVRDAIEKTTGSVVENRPPTYEDQVETALQRAVTDVLRSRIDASVVPEEAPDVYGTKTAAKAAEAGESNRDMSHSFDSASSLLDR
jgi:subtilisin family serine protease